MATFPNNRSGDVRSKDMTEPLKHFIYILYTDMRFFEDYIIWGHKYQRKFLEKLKKPKTNIKRFYMWTY